MAQTKTLLNGMNDLLKKVKVIQGDVSELTTFTDPGRQQYIDIGLQNWNEAIDRLYNISNKPMPQELSSSTITLVTDDRSYALATDENKLRWPLQDTTNGTYIYEYPGGYHQMLIDQSIPANYTGVPQYAAISPVNGELYLDRIPTSSENGLVYTYQYDKDLEVTLITDTFPFKDVVYRSLLPAVAELWKRDVRSEFDSAAFNTFMAQSVSYLKEQGPGSSYRPRRSVLARTDPYA